MAKLTDKHKQVLIERVMEKEGNLTPNTVGTALEQSEIEGSGDDLLDLQTAFSDFQGSVGEGFQSRQTPVNPEIKHSVEGGLVWEQLLLDGNSVGGQVWSDIYQQAETNAQQPGEYFQEMWGRFKAKDPTLSSNHPRETSFILSIMPHAAGVFVNDEEEENAPGPESQSPQV